MNKKPNRPESLRKKGVCSVCLNYKPIKTKNKCQNCHHKWKRKNDYNFFLRTRYTEIKQRCTNPKNKRYENYKNKLEISLEDFLKKFKNDLLAQFIWNEWRKNPSEKTAPSIDRIDNTKGYNVDNIQFITMDENRRKDREKTSINVFKDGSFVFYFESQSKASEVLKLPQANIWKVLNKERKKCGGYYFEYA